jgi:Flp pilus assembly protein TadG
MSRYRVAPRARKPEQGQTIVLVALTIVTMLAMAALAIDVVTLYVARSEMQRAADAAALAGARAFVDSGVTSDPANATLQSLAQNMATAMINSTVQQNKISGVQPALAGAPAFDFTRPGNPQLSVTLQRTDLLVINKDPNRAGAPFVTDATGAPAPGVIGEELQLTPACILAR